MQKWEYANPSIVLKHVEATIGWLLLSEIKTHEEDGWQYITHTIDEGILTVLFRRAK